MALVTSGFIFHHDNFDKYAEDHINVVINMAAVFLILSEKAYTVPEISNKLNTQDRLSNKRTKYDANALILRLQRWGYVEKEKDSEKYKFNYFYWHLTKKGMDLLKKMPRYLAMGIKLYEEAYTAYIKKGLL